MKQYENCGAHLTHSHKDYCRKEKKRKKLKTKIKCAKEKVGSLILNDNNCNYHCHYFYTDK